MDETRPVLRRAAVEHNVGVLRRCDTISNTIWDDLVDVADVLRRYDEGEPLKDV